MTGAPADESGAPGRGIVLALQVTIDAVEQARLAVAASLAGHGLDDLVLHRVEVILEELVSNVVRHAAGATGLWLSVGRREGDLHIRIEDDGPAFDPLARPDPAPYTSLEDAIPGGQGIALVKRLSRRVSYSRLDGRNRLDAAIAVGGE